LEHLSYRATAKFVVNSVAVAESLSEQEEIERFRTEVIYNGVELPEIDPVTTAALRQKFGFSDATVVVGMIANFWPHKNHLLLVKAAKEVVARVPQVIFVLAGSYYDYQRRIEAEIYQQDLAAHFRILGPINNASDLLPAVDLSVLCSGTEGFSNTILEYMAHGLPVIATRVGGNPEAVLDGQTGCLIDSHDSSALARAILGLVCHPEKRKEMGQRGRERVKANFSWDGAVGEWEALFQSLLAHRFSDPARDTR
jgi:glycosyltransferase involved in cell wall biosynthesis